MISVIMPTYGRPEQAVRTVRRFLETTDERARLIAIVDNAERKSYQLLRQSFGGHCRVLLSSCPEHTGPVAIWNKGAAAADADYYVMGGDDIDFPDGWLDNALNVYMPGCLLSMADGMRALATHYMVDKQAMREILGGVLCVPHYFSQYLDIEATYRAMQLRRLILTRQPIFEHRHPVFKTAERDATHAIGTKWAPVDRGVFQERQEAGFPNDYEPII